ncbi:MAG: sigma 54-interacting transcriptional regulator, partial [Acidobacteriota bacterium]
LAAAELFGAKKGAYTGAHQDKVGYFRKAGGGTLFLDEIGEATAEVQALLLRALETHEIVPVGDTEPQEVAARVIAATDADLESGMADNSFRAALFHRVAGYSLALPPLRDRRDDIGRLFFHFLDGELRRLGPSSEDADCVELDGRPWPEAALVARLARSDWPGNVRQLRNVARWMAVQGPGADLGGELGALIGDESRGEPPDGESTEEPDPVVDARPKAPLQFHRTPRDVGEEELLAALKLHGWRLKPTASYLRVSRTSLYALIDRCQSIRRAGDLTADELRESCERHGCDLTAMSKELEVSPQGLRHRLQSLGLGPSAGRPNG